MEYSHVYNIANKSMQNPDDKSRSLKKWDQSQKGKTDNLDQETPTRMQNDSQNRKLLKINSKAFGAPLILSGKIKLRG